MSASGFIVYILMQLLANEVIILASEQRSTRLLAKDRNHIVLGGLFPIHAKGRGPDQRCGSMLLEKGIQRMEAMFYAIDKINNNTIDYWRFKLSATIIDTCSSKLYALQQSLQFLDYSCGPRGSIGRKVTTVVSASDTLVTAAVAKFLNVFQIPHVSYTASSSVELDDLHEYPYFFRVVPSNTFQVQVIVDVLAHFGWTYVSMVVSQGEYGENVVRTMQEQILNSTLEICFATVETLPKDAEQKHYDSVVYRLDNFEKAKVVVVFLSEDKVIELLDACERRGIPPGRFVFVGSDSWGTKDSIVQKHQKIAEDAITVSLKMHPVEGFDKYFTSLRPSSNHRNPWFKEYWENKFNCVFENKGEMNKSQTICRENETLDSVYKQENLVPTVINSVHLLATVIKTLCERHPSFCRNPKKMFQKYEFEFLGILRNITLNSSPDQDMLISFDKRSVPVIYTVAQYIKNSSTGNKYAYSVLGEWNSTKGLNILSYPNWYMEERRPISKYDDECHVGEQRVFDRQGLCFLRCAPCEPLYYLPDPKKPCEKCPEGTVPSSDVKSCTASEMKYFGRDLGNVWALGLLIFSTVGLISTAAVFLIFYLNRKTPLIIASGTQLCYFIFAGIACCYCYSFVALLQPTVFSCGALRIGMGLGLSICYSAIFTKTNCSFRMFEYIIKFKNPPSCISPQSQLMMCICPVLIQVILSILWIVIKTPEIPAEFLLHDNEWLMYCKMGGISLFLGLAHNMVLLILSTTYAHKTRRLAVNFNEAQWICLTMYASCAIWIAFIPLYWVAVSDTTDQSITLAMSVSISGTVFLVCMFLPKIYLIIVHPEKNVFYSSSAIPEIPTNDNEQPVRYVRNV